MFIFAYMILVIIAFVALGFVACWLWVKFVYWLFWPKSKPKPVNPYIEAHQVKLHNDALYDQYEDWLAKHGSGVPIPKIKSPEDIEAEKKIKKLF